MTSRYDLVAIVLHWSIALLIATAFLLGLTVDDFPKAWNNSVVNVHALMGLTILALTTVRIGWRLAHKPPPLPKSSSPLLGKLSKTVHFVLYLLMLVVPAIGVPTLLYRGRGVDFGLFEIPQFLPRVPEIFHPLTELHELSAYALLGLGFGHIFAALYHQIVLRDRLVWRMVPQANGEAK
ncbi:MAG TPA: cytochrome b [Rhodocyclaceae bacterium]|nr:cytochrome b [Rhodocyclaceae bacterium]